MMMTKREVLEYIAKEGTCKAIECNKCPYDDIPCHNRFFKIGIMALLRMFPEKEKIDINNILTSITADQAKEGMKGYFADSLSSLRTMFENKVQTSSLIEILDETHMCRFRQSGRGIYSLFYPIEEED